MSDGRREGDYVCHTAIESVFFSPDSRRLVLIKKDGTSSQSRIDGKWEEQQWLDYDGTSVLGSFSPDFRNMVTFSANDVVRTMICQSDEDWKNGLSQKLKYEGLVCTKIFSGDAQYLVITLRDSTARILIQREGKWQEIYEDAHHRNIIFVLFSPDDRSLVTISDVKIARLLTLNGGKCKEVGRVEYAEKIKSVKFSPDGRSVVIITNDKIAHILIDGIPKAIQIEHVEKVTSVNFSPDSRSLVVISNSPDVAIPDDKIIHILILNDDEWEEELQVRHGAKVTLKFSPDGRSLATISDDNTIRILTQIKGKWREDRKIEYDAKVQSVSFSPDSLKLVIALDDNSIRIMDYRGTDNGNNWVWTQRFNYDCSVLSTTFGPDGLTLVNALSDGSIRVLACRRGKHLTQVQQLVPSEGGAARFVRFSADGLNLLLVLDSKNSVTGVEADITCIYTLVPQPSQSQDDISAFVCAP